ncbi:MAG: hypothetical protein J5848_07265 [Bacteroidales bacterium]|nr:hypothetical protein [Bacteroidales bacterium]
MKILRITFFLLLICAFSSVQAQYDNGIESTDASPNGIATPEITNMSARDLCRNYNVDVRIVDNHDNIVPIMDSLQKTQTNAYPLMSQWCRAQKNNVQKMLNSLRKDFSFDGNMLWIDSTHCIVDAGAYISKLEQTASYLESRASYFDSREQERIENERRIAEERERAEAARIQREKEMRMQRLTDSIRSLHQTIDDICHNKGVTEKARIKELKDIFYDSYLPIYNRFNLTSTDIEDERYAQLSELKEFQVNLVNNVISDTSYSQRIEKFKDIIKVRCGKDHSEVNKSYLKVHKKLHVPIKFKSIAEFNEYVGQVQEIILVQKSYLEVINLRETITSNSNKIQAQCGKKYRDIFNSYKEILGEQDLVPSFTTLNDANSFIKNLTDFITLQSEYNRVILRIDSIGQRNDSIIAACPKNISDVSASYKELVDATDFIPRFRNISSANFYNKSLDDFEQIQQIYFDIIGLRTIIVAKSDTINSSKTSPKGLTAGYKTMIKYNNFTPNFSTVKDGQDFVASLNYFIRIQNKFIKIIKQTEQIEAAGKRFKSAFKNYSNIYKAYERLLKTYDYDLKILSEGDLDSYLLHQKRVLDMQEKFEELINSPEKGTINEKLKKMKEPERIKQVMGVQ